MRAKAGFTLIELVMVIVMAAALSTFAMARANLFSGWGEAGAAQSVASYLHAAQKLAMANRTTVYVSVGASQLRVCYDAACASPCSNIDGSAMALTAPSGAMSATTSIFSFDPQGIPSTSAQNVVSYNGATVTIEPGTGLIW